jgi:hypothetical protein
VFVVARTAMSFVIIEIVMMISHSNMLVLLRLLEVLLLCRSLALLDSR